MELSSFFYLLGFFSLTFCAIDLIQEYHFYKKHKSYQDYLKKLKSEKSNQDFDDKLKPM